MERGSVTVPPLPVMPDSLGPGGVRKNRAPVQAPLRAR